MSAPDPPPAETSPHPDDHSGNERAVLGDIVRNLMAFGIGAFIVGILIFCIVIIITAMLTMPREAVFILFALVASIAAWMIGNAILREMQR